MAFINNQNIDGNKFASQNALRFATQVAENNNDDQKSQQIPTTFKECTVEHLILSLKYHNTFNHREINDFKHTIIEHIKLSTINGIKLSTIPRKKFSDNLVKCINGVKKIKGPANKYWDELMQQEAIKELPDKTSSNK